jgi:hypothetical protein
MKKICILLVFIAVLSACNKSENPQEPTTISGPAETTPGVVLFRSGFESDTYLSAPSGAFETSNWSDYDIVKGTDSSTGYTWPIKILGSNFGGIHKVDDDDGFAIENRIETVTGPTGEETTALYQNVKYDVGFTQTPYQINNIAQNPKELYMSYWMKTDDISLSGEDEWRAIWEYKTDNYENQDNGFRMIAFMATDEQGTKHWVFQGDTNPQNLIWQEKNYSIPVQMNKWFKVEYYLKWSDGSDGYASMKVNGQLIAEHSGPTTTNSDNLDFIILTQVYGNTHPMYQWIDDIEIWDGTPN